MPEEVARVVYDAGRLADVCFAVESGAIGGLPAPGLFFGAALRPRRIVSSAALFARCARQLAATCVGALQVDSAGNVNVSRRGPGARGFVGPGGFIDLTTAARTIVFVCAWKAHGDTVLDARGMQIGGAGTAKFVDRVDEVTFNGARALAAGQRVFYATHVGLFRLTRRGMKLVRRMPGIDVRRDVLAQTAMRIVLPRRPVPALSPALVLAPVGPAWRPFERLPR